MLRLSPKLVCFLVKLQGIDLDTNTKNDCCAGLFILSTYVVVKVTYWNIDHTVQAETTQNQTKLPTIIWNQVALLPYYLKLCPFFETYLELAEKEHCKSCVNSKGSLVTKLKVL